MVQEYPPNIVLRCADVTPIGEDIIRSFDEKECVISTKVFLLLYSGNVFGTTQFKTLNEFISFKNAECEPCTEPCGLTYRDCILTYRGLNLNYNPN